MLTTRPAAVLALATFLLGGWLPMVLHGPVLPAAAAGLDERSHHCGCVHEHGTHESPTDAGDVAGSQSHDEDCPVCELMSVLAAPTGLEPVLLPQTVLVRSEGRKIVVVCTDEHRRPLLRGPPRG